MKVLKTNKKLIAAFAAGAIIFSGVGYAANEYLAGDIRYTKSGASSSISVAEALNELYEMKKNYVLPSGTLNITDNGNYDVTNKASVNVNVNTLSKTLLWTNSNPNVAMAASDISLSSSLNNFSHILVQYKVAINSTIVYENLFKITPNRENAVSNVGYYTVGGCIDDLTSQRKLAYKDATTLRAGNAITATGDTLTNVLIPLSIYGLNFSY